MVEAARRMEDVGADLVLVDGAYGRAVGAHPDLTSHVVVSTGAASAGPGDDLGGVTRATRDLVDRLAPPTVSEPWHRALATRAIEEDRTLLGTPGGAHTPLTEASALLGLRHWHPDTDDQHTAIAIPGLISDSVAEALLARAGVLEAVLISDGTALHASSRVQRRLHRALEVRAVRSATVLGVSVNPTRLVGPPLERGALLDALRRELAGIPVFDPHEDLLLGEG